MNPFPRSFLKPIVCSRARRNLDICENAKSWTAKSFRIVASVYDRRWKIHPPPALGETPLQKSFGTHRQRLQRLYSIEKISFAEIEIIRVPIAHPWDFVAGRVGHEMQEKGVFIHHSRISVKFGHLMGFVEFAMRVSLQDEVSHDLLVTAVVPEIRRAFFKREAIRILQDLL